MKFARTNPLTNFIQFAAYSLILALGLGLQGTAEAQPSSHDRMIDHFTHLNISQAFVDPEQINRILGEDQKGWEDTLQSFGGIVRESCDAKANVEARIGFNTTGTDPGITAPWIHQDTVATLVSSCGREFWHNLKINRQEDGTTWTLWTLPGTTLAGIDLQSDVYMALSSGYMAIKMLDFPECDNFWVLDTQPLRVDTPAGIWTERWHVQICQDVHFIEVLFSPDGRGGHYYQIKKHGT